MNTTRTVATARDALAEAIVKTTPVTCSPLNTSPWLAMSALQKAVRRGHEDIALRAAARLLQISPPRLWRRCTAIAFEDIGVADLTTVSLVVAGASGKQFRSTVGTEWHVASYIVSRMVRSSKCRAADDLLIAADQHPGFDHWRAELAAKPKKHLLEIVAGDRHPLPARAIALWYAVGTNKWSAPHLRPRLGQSQAAFDHLVAAGAPPDLVETCRQGFGRTGEALAPFVALLSMDRRAGPTGGSNPVDDAFPPSISSGKVPGWALDMYSREGRAAIKLFLSGNGPAAVWIRRNIPPGLRVNFAGGIIFRVEGGLMRSRLRWPAADELRRLADFECHGPYCPDASEILDLMRADIPALNEVRLHVL